MATRAKWIRTILDWSAGLCFLAVGLGAARSHGAYSLPDLVSISAACLLFAANFVRAEETRLDPRPGGVFLSLVFFLFMNRLAQHPTLIYAARNSSMAGMRVVLYAVLVFSSVVLLFNVWKKENEAGVLRRFGLPCLGLLLAAQILVPLASPDPQIDVFTIAREACARFFSGSNPYGFVYTDIYKGAYGYRPVFNYPPGVLLWIAPFEWLLGDLRAGYVVASIGTIILLSKMCMLLRVEGTTALKLLLLWAAVPSTFFVLEQAWVDTLLVFFTALSFWFLWRERWFCAGLALGYQATVKQYGFLVAVFVVLYLVRRRRWRQVLRMGGGVALILCCVVGPFLAWDPHALWTNLATDILTQPVRLDALTWRSAFFHLKQVNPTSLIYSLIPISVFIWVGAEQLTRPRGWGRVLQGIALFHAALFLFAKQSFCNYYYYLGFLIFLAVVYALRGSPEASPGGLAISD